MKEDQRLARIFGILYLVTFVTSIPALPLYEPALRNPASYVAGGGHDAKILFAVLLELLLIISDIGTAVVPFPIFRRQSEPLAIGYITARVIECTFIAAGIIFMLGIVSLRHDSPHAADLAVSYAALKDWTLRLGPGFIVGWGNGLILAYIMYRSQLVPRAATWLGLIGGPLLIVVATAILFTGNPSNQLHGLNAIATIPEALWELFLGVYCTIWGFRKDSPVLSDSAHQGLKPVSPATAVPPG